MAETSGKDCRLNPANKRTGNENQQSNSGNDEKNNKNNDKNQKEKENDTNEVKYTPKSTIACSPHTTFELHDDF
jgi:hypothetical protein